MANLSQLQMPSIDTGQLSGKDGKKIKATCSRYRKCCGMP